MSNPLPVALSRPALIVVDMQNEFLAEGAHFELPNAANVIDHAKRLLVGFRERHLPVFFTRHVYLTPSKDGGKTAAWWSIDDSSPVLREGMLNSQIVQGLRPLEGERCIAKRRYSAFYATDLELLLRAEKVEEVVICGVATNICCEATAHDAFFRDFRVIVSSDATAGTSPEADSASLANLALCYAHVAETDQILNILNSIIP